MNYGMERGGCLHAQVPGRVAALMAGHAEHAVALALKCAKQAARQSTNVELVSQTQ
jgi:hypothetical protein